MRGGCECETGKRAEDGCERVHDFSSARSAPVIKALRVAGRTHDGITRPGNRLETIASGM